MKSILAAIARTLAPYILAAIRRRLDEALDKRSGHLLLESESDRCPLCGRAGPRPETEPPRERAA